MDTALLEVMDSFADPEEKCLILSTNEFELNAPDRQVMRFNRDYADEDLRENIAAESQCSILLFGGNRSRASTYAESKYLYEAPFVSEPWIIHVS